MFKWWQRLKEKKQAKQLKEIEEIVHEDIIEYLVRTPKVPSTTAAIEELSAKLNLLVKQNKKLKKYPYTIEVELVMAHYDLEVQIKVTPKD